MVDLVHTLSAFVNPYAISVPTRFNIDLTFTLHLFDK